MKLALAQCAPFGPDTEAALTHVATTLRAARAAGAEMVVFPELLLPGYNQPKAHRALAQPQGGAWETSLSRICSETGCGLTAGWAERDGDRIYNAVSCFDGTGRKLAHYRKIQLFGPMEQSVFTFGDQYTVFDLGPHKAALLICYDVEFAHHGHALAAQGVDLLLVPTANARGFEMVPDLLVPARAYETRMTIAYANYCGSDNGLAFGGHSVVAGPDGAPLAKAGMGDSLLIADLSAVTAIDPTLLSTQATDRRDVP